MKVAFHIPRFVEEDQRGELALLWCDFIRETALSFGASLVIVGADKSVKKLFPDAQVEFIDDINSYGSRKIILKKRAGSIRLQDYPTPKNQDFVLVLGSDDRPDEEVIGDHIHIDTATTRDLWAGVAAGIVLNHFRN